MKTYAHTYVDIRDVCQYNNLDILETMDAISNSHISFGTNADTLISQNQFRSIMEDFFDNVVLDFSRLDPTVLISLGS